MSDSPVPVIVVTAQQDDVEFINRTLRDAGHPVHCHWINEVDRLGDALEIEEPELIMFFADQFPASTSVIAKIRYQRAQMVPLVEVRAVVDETMITDAMDDGAQDLVSVGQRLRIKFVAEREMRAFRLERALNDTLNSSTRYKRQVKAFMAVSVDAIAEVQEGNEMAK